MTNNIKIFKLQKWRNFVSTHPRVHVVDVSSVRGLGTLQSFILLEIELIHTVFKRGLSGLHNRRPRLRWNEADDRDVDARIKKASKAFGALRD